MRVEVEWGDDVVTYVRRTSEAPHAAPCQLGIGFQEDYVVDVPDALVEAYEAAWGAYVKARRVLLTAAQEEHSRLFGVLAPSERS